MPSPGRYAWPAEGRAEHPRLLSSCRGKVVDARCAGMTSEQKARWTPLMGGRQIARGIWDIGETSLSELAYVWPDIDNLIEACLKDTKTE